MNQLPPILFDYSRLRSRIERAHNIAASDAGFLAEIAANEIADRVKVTNRQFQNAVDLFSTSGHLAKSLKNDRPGMAIRQLMDKKGDYDRDTLNLACESSDLAVSVFGLHWCNDLPGTLRQISDLLVPDGLFLAAIPSEGTLNELRQSLLAVESQMCPGAAMRIDPFAEIKQVGALLQRAGLALPVTDSEQYILRYSNVRSLVRELRTMAATCTLSGDRTNLPRGFMDRLETEYRSKFSDDDGKIRVTVNLVYMTAWKPHESQQKPQKPGSAKHSLANALKP